MSCFKTGEKCKDIQPIQCPDNPCETALCPNLSFHLAEKPFNVGFL